MERRDLIIALCHSAGDTGAEEDLVATWEANHACCCAFHVDNAMRGDVATLNNIRRCMGLQPDG